MADARRTPRRPLAYAVLAAVCAAVFALGVGMTLMMARGLP